MSFTPTVFTGSTPVTYAELNKLGSQYGAIYDSMGGTLSNIWGVGSTNSGKWIKYADGRLEIWNRFQIDGGMPCTTAAGAFYTTGVLNDLPNFPVAFVGDLPVVDLVYQGDASGHPSWLLKGYPATLTAMSTYEIYSISAVVNFYPQMAYFA